MWMFEYGSRTRDGNVRWTLAVTALEALIHTDREGSTWQFKTRTAALARRLGFEGWTEETAAAAYNVRSAVTHGQQPSQLSEPEERQADLALEPLLRSVLRSAIEDDSLRDLLRDDARIRRLSRPE
jgi:regulator of protease activity HflC (stomatin/prohibitin superfamily)